MRRIVLSWRTRYIGSEQCTTYQLPPSLIAYNATYTEELRTRTSIPHDYTEENTSYYDWHIPTPEDR